MRSSISRLKHDFEGFFPRNRPRFMCARSPKIYILLEASCSLEKLDRFKTKSSRICPPLHGGDKSTMGMGMNVFE